MTTYNRYRVGRHKFRRWSTFFLIFELFGHACTTECFRSLRGTDELCTPPLFELPHFSSCATKSFRSNSTTAACWLCTVFICSSTNSIHSTSHHSESAPLNTRFLATVSSECSTQFCTTDFHDVECIPATDSTCSCSASSGGTQFCPDTSPPTFHISSPNESICGAACSCSS